MKITCSIVATLLIAATVANGAPITTLDTAYIGLQKDIKLPNGLEVRGLLSVDGPSTITKGGEAKVVKAIAMETKKIKAQRTTSLDTQARRIRSPNTAVLHKVPGPH